MAHEWVAGRRSHEILVRIDWRTVYFKPVYHDAQADHCRVCGDARSIGSTYDGPCPGKDSREAR